MNKYKIFLALCLTPQLIFAQGLNIKPMTSMKTFYVEKQNKEIKYSISIKKDDQIFLSSNFYIKNENSIVLYNQEKIIEQKQINKKNAAANSEQIILSQETQDIQEAQSSEISLVLHLDKNGKNIASEFFSKSLEAGKQDKVALLNQENNKAVAIETTPLFKKEDSKILITHLKNEETIFIWENKEFTIKANF